MSHAIDPHPIRLWRIQRDLGTKLQTFRGWNAKSRRKHGPCVDGMQFVERPFDIDPRATRNFQDLQAYLFKHDEATLFLDWFLRFWDEHRQVYSFDPAVAEALAATDVSDVPWAELRLPHPEFYVSLGDYGQASFAIGEMTYVIDGAYVRHVPRASALFPNDSTLFLFTSRLVAPSYRDAIEARTRGGFHFAEPTYEYCLSGAGCTTVGEAIVKGDTDYLTVCDKRDSVAYEGARQLAPQFGLLPFGPRLHAVRRKFESSRAMILEAVPPLLNALFYLSACPENRAEQFPASAPQKLLQSYRLTSTPSQRDSIERALAQKGFTKVVFIRDPDFAPASPLTAAGRHVRAHWRRGHWRNQAYGKDLAHRRWRWIKPVVVKPAEGPLQSGTIHQVRPATSPLDPPAPPVPPLPNPDYAA